MRVQRVYIWCRSRNRCRVSVNLINLQRNCNSKNVKSKMGKEWKAKKKVIIVAKAIHQTMTAFFTRTTQGFENEIFPFLNFLLQTFLLRREKPIIIFLFFKKKKIRFILPILNGIFQKSLFLKLFWTSNIIFENWKDIFNF